MILFHHPVEAGKTVAKSAACRREGINKLNLVTRHEPHHSLRITRNVILSPGLSYFCLSSHHWTNSFCRNTTWKWRFSILAGYRHFDQFVRLTFFNPLLRQMPPRLEKPETYTNGRTRMCLSATRATCMQWSSRWQVNYQLTTVTQGGGRRWRRRPYLHPNIAASLSEEQGGGRELMTNPPPQSHSVSIATPGLRSVQRRTALHRITQQRWKTTTWSSWRLLGSLPRLSSLECSFCLVRISHGLRLWASLARSFGQSWRGGSEISDDVAFFGYGEVSEWETGGETEWYELKSSRYLLLRWRRVQSPTVCLNAQSFLSGKWFIAFSYPWSNNG